MSETEAPQMDTAATPGNDVAPPAGVVPSPADAATQAAKELHEEESKPPRTAEQLEAELAKVRREAAGYRTKLREAEPIVKAHEEAQDAAKTEVEKANERANKLEQDFLALQAENWQLDLASQYGIPHEERDLIGSGSREEMEARAARLGPRFATSDKTPPPPSNRPVEGLRPGASPEPPKAEDDSYPSSWIPPHIQSS